jgi:hypothetical protein
MSKCWWPSNWFQVLVVAALLGSAILPANAQEEPPPQLVTNAPVMGTFYLLGQIPSVPYPFDPYHGALPVYAYDGVFFVDNSQVSLMEQSFSFDGGEGGGMMLMSSPSPPGGFAGTNSMTNLFCSGLTNFVVSYRYSTNALSLGIAQSTNTFIDLTIHTATTNTSYDVFGTTNLTTNVTGLNRTNWVWLARISGGTTNYSWGLTNWCERYFQLGTMVDDDLDGLTTAYEILVSHTKWEAGDGWDSDGDGLSDDFELRHSLTDPNNPDTGNTGTPDGYKDPDGDGWTHLDEMRNSTNPLVFNTPAAPVNFQVQVVSNGTSLLLTWEPSGGTVTGYAINGYFFNFQTNIGANAQSLLITNTGNMQAQFQIYALYPNNVNVPSAPVSPFFRPALNPTAYRLRGPGNSRYVAVQAPPSSVASLFLSDPSSGDTASIPAANFSDGLTRLPDSALTNSYAYINGYFLYAQWVETNGLMGVPNLSNCQDLLEENSESTQWPHLPFVDARQVILDNAKFALRAATLKRQFSFANTYPNYLGRFPVSTNYEVAEFHTRYTANSLAPDVRRPFQENHLWRNFCFDEQFFDMWGSFTTGAYYNWSLDSRVLQSPWFEYDGSSHQSQLASNVSRWIYFGGVDTISQERTNIGITISGTNWLVGSITNRYGLPLRSIVFHRSPTVEDYTNRFYLRNVGETIQPGFYNAFYDFEEPSLQTVDSVFSAKTFSEGYLNWAFASPVPGTTGFTPTNPPAVIIAGVGGSAYVSGWTRKRILNGTADKYAYLEQFFDKAFKADANGYPTTNETGVLSEFGEFFPTEPGRVILTTQPDIETSEVGAALVNVISLNVDANHDGTMDRTFAGPDTTSAQRPFRFWLNNDSDTANGETDSPYSANNLDSRINGERDMEDFARLWVSGVPTLPEGYTAILSWNVQSGSPALNLYSSVEADGGTLYLTDLQTAHYQSEATQDGTGTWSGIGVRLGELSPGNSFTFPSGTFSNSFRRHFLFEATGRGSGELVLRIEHGGQVIAETRQFMEFKDIKEMYERWTVGEVGSVQPWSEARLASELLPSGVPPFAYTHTSSDTNLPYILHVHGWNMKTSRKDIYGETMFKRLYWQGYQGRFGIFRWPTGFNFPGQGFDEQAFDLNNYDKSEWQAWKSAAGLRELLRKLNVKHPGRVRLSAHSMGNVVAGEALRINDGTRLAAVYVAMQAAVPSHAYDATAPTRSILSVFDDETPNRYAEYWQQNSGPYFSDFRGATRYINFYNPDDFALNSWLTDQDFKPANSLCYSYFSPSGQFTKGGCFGPSQVLTFPTNTHELFSFSVEARCLALGAQADVQGLFQTEGQVLLNQAPYNFGNQVRGHSAQFLFTYMECHLFFDELLKSFELEERP